MLVKRPSSPAPSFRDRQQLTRRFGVVEDVRDVLRELRVFLRATLLPIFPDELFELVGADYDAIREYLQSSEKVRVFRHRNWLFRNIFTGFELLVDPKGIGFVFYPGAFFKTEAYAPICRRLGDMGYHAALCTPPVLLSLADVDLADEVLRYFRDDVNLWTVSGHSMGGVVAAAYANQHVKEFKDKLKGVVLLASYPSAVPELIAGGDLSDDLYVTASIYGSLDGLTTESFIEASKYFLPSTAKYVCIEGGNHSHCQFYYGTQLQLGDRPATISREEQQKITLQSICQVLTEIEEDEARVAKAS